MNMRLRTLLAQHHMQTTRGHVGHTGFSNLAFMGFNHFHHTTGRQPGSERRGKAGRHVLHNKHRYRQGRFELAEDFHQRHGAAGRNGNADGPRRVTDHLFARISPPVVCRGKSWALLRRCRCSRLCVLHRCHCRPWGIIAQGRARLMAATEAHHLGNQLLFQHLEYTDAAR